MCLPLCISGDTVRIMKKAFNILKNSVGLVLVLVVTGCAGGMVQGHLISLEDGVEHPFAIQNVRHGSGLMSATNQISGETFSGRYTMNLHGGGTTYGTVYSRCNAPVGTVATICQPDVTGRGFLKGDKGTVIQVFLNINPGWRSSGSGEGLDNSGHRYQIQF